MKIVIVEDESAAINQLKFLLNQLNIEHEIVATIESVADGKNWFTTNENADLIFSDIQLADGISFEIYEHIKIHSPIIFTTAFDEFAIRAFKLNSIDYILKPIDAESLSFAIGKFKNQQLFKQEKLQDLIKNQTFIEKDYRKSFLVRFREKLLPIRIEEFAYFFIENGIVFGRTHDERKFVIELKLEDLELQLNPADFKRANRQFIVSRKCIVAIESFFNSRVKVIVKPDSSFELIISKEKVTLFKNWFEKG